MLLLQNKNWVQFPTLLHTYRRKEMIKKLDSRSRKSLTPTTTLQEDLVTEGQRRVNLIWEYTQAFIAIVVVITSLVAAIWAMSRGKEVSAFLSFIAGNVVGFYFSRTNHQAIGGTGKKVNEDQSYMGR